MRSVFVTLNLHGTQALGAFVADELSLNLVFLRDA